MSLGLCTYVLGQKTAGFFTRRLFPPHGCLCLVYGQSPFQVQNANVPPNCGDFLRWFPRRLSLISRLSPRREVGLWNPKSGRAYGLLRPPPLTVAKRGWINGFQRNARKSLVNPKPLSNPVWQPLTPPPFFFAPLRAGSRSGQFVQG